MFTKESIRILMENDVPVTAKDKHRILESDKYCMISPECPSIPLYIVSDSNKSLEFLRLPWMQEIKIHGLKTYFRRQEWTILYEGDSEFMSRIDWNCKVATKLNLVESRSKHAQECCLYIDASIVSARDNILKNNDGKDISIKDIISNL